jgi:hypothetical protein
VSLFANDDLLRRLSDRSQEHVRQYSLASSLEGWEKTLRDVAATPPLQPRPGTTFPFADVDRRAGRLEAIGLSPSLADALRRLTRRFPDLGSGWGEWPGTVTPPSFAPRAFTEDDLASLDRELGKASG